MPTLSGTVYAVTRAAWKASAAKLRASGRLAVHPQWTARAEVCARCPMAVVQCGVTYCGRPFKSMPVRDNAIDGCGCPTHAKAKDPAEHCPLTSDHLSIPPTAAICKCKWCKQLASA